jgi:hypothetical protein
MYQWVSVPPAQTSLNPGRVGLLNWFFSQQ